MAVSTSTVPMPFNASTGVSFSYNGYAEPNALGTYRGIGSSWFNGRRVAYEDYMRNLQTIDYQNAFNAEQAMLDRQFQLDENQKNRDFQASETQKNRDWQEYMENTTVARMKAQGINPILAYQSAGHSAPGGGVASGSTSAGSRATSSTHGFLPNSTGDALGSLLGVALQVGAGLLTKGMANKALAMSKFKVGF